MRWFINYVLSAFQDGKKNKTTTKHSSLQGQRLFHDYNREFVVAEAALPVGLENLRKWRDRSFWGLMSLREAAWKGLRPLRDRKFSVQMPLPFLHSRKKTEHYSLWGKCMWEGVKFEERSTVLREDDLSALFSNSKLVAGVAVFNYTSWVGLL